MTIIRGLSLTALCMLLQATSTYAQTHGHTTTPHPNSTSVADRFGVVVMAHGGPESWNVGVNNMLDPLKTRYDLELAFGMADAYSIQEAVGRLEARGVTDIGVVRLFISGESWLQRTQQILGMVPGAPDRPMQAHSHTPDESHGSHRMEFWQLDSRARFSVNLEGLSEAPEMNEVLLQRAQELSVDPANENVLILAHGPGDDAENERWLKNINARAELLREKGGFNTIKVATLREDWPEKREAAQADVREFVSNGSAAGRRVLVIPYRVYGFGPYAQVLDGLDYVADAKGLVPHPAVAHWIERQISLLE